MEAAKSLWPRVVRLKVDSYKSSSENVQRSGHLTQASCGGFLDALGATEGVALLRQSPIKTGLCKGIVGLSENRQRSVRAATRITSNIISAPWHELTRLVSSLRVCRPSVGIQFTVAAVGRAGEPAVFQHSRPVWLLTQGISRFYEEGISR